jgi:putative methyltransferase (TIGR04325 family)
MRTRLRALVPESARAWWRRRFGWRWFRGDYASWAEARAQASAEDGSAGLARVRAAAQAVRAGAAAWDRDGVTFARPAVHAPLLAALQRSAAAHGGRLAVVDFGGGLGSTWRQHRAALAGVTCAGWRVVERPALAGIGRGEFAEGPLEFHDSLAEALAAGPATTLLLSSVLPYLEEPYALLAAAVAAGFPEVIIDRTPCVPGGRDRIVVQHTPPALGGGSHPCRLFDRASLSTALAPHYALVAEWPVPFDQVDHRVEYRGLHFRRRPPSTP